MSSPKRQTILLAHPGAELFGSDRMLLESASGLVSENTHVIVALPSRGPLEVALRAAGVDVVVLPMFVLRKSLLTPRGLPRLVKDAIRGVGATWRVLRKIRPSVVYVSTVTIPLWPLIARLRRIPTVSHIHEAEASSSRHINRALYLPHLASTRVIVNSAFTAKTVRSVLPKLADRAQVILNGVGAPEYPVSPRAELDHMLRIVYIGRLSPRKGPDLVIDAAARLQKGGQPVSVMLVGATFTGYEWFEAELRAQAAASGVAVTFAGFNSDVWSFLAQSDVLVAPSRMDESFGNTAVEGILALRPVIVSDNSGLREAVEGYATASLFPIGDAAALAHQLREVAMNWDALCDATAEAAHLANQKHAPARYRIAVRDVVLSVG